jgi:hypothetical protein
MECIEKPHTNEYKEITNDWNYDASCTLTSLPVWDLENFKRLIFVVQSLHSRVTDIEYYIRSRPRCGAQCKCLENRLHQKTSVKIGGL